MTQDIRVEIFGQVYSIRTSLDPDYIEQLARTVDARMSALARQTETVDTRRLAVLAALNLADELQQQQNQVPHQRSALPPEFISRLEECNRLLDSVLDSSVQR